MIIFLQTYTYRENRTTVFGEPAFKSDKGGFTLIEVLVYLGLYSLIMTGALVSVYTIFGSSAHNQARAMVQEEGAYLSGKIDWALSNAKTIQAPITTGSTLSLTRYDNSTVTISLMGSDIQISENSATPVTLNNSNVRVTSLQFTHTQVTADGINPESVRAVMTVDTNASDGISFARTFSTLKYLRK